MRGFLRLEPFARFVVLLGIIGLSVVSQTAFFNSDALIAIRGFSAIEFVAAMNNPTGFQQDFPGGSRVTTSATPLTWLHLFASRAGIDSLHFYYVMVTFEIVSLLAGAYILMGAITKRGTDPNRIGAGGAGWPFLVLSTFLVLSNGQMMDLSRFSAPFFHGQFYGFADGLRLAAFGFALERKWWQAAVLLSAAFVIHPVKGLIGGVVVLVAFVSLFARGRFFKSSFQLAIFPVVSAAWSVLTLSRATVGVELDEFVAWTRVFQSHWYPIDLGVVTTGKFEYLMPLSFITVAALLGTGRILRNWPAKIAISGSIIVLTILTLAGVAISAWPINQFLIQLSLVRASELVVQLALTLIVIFASDCLRTRNYFWASLFLLPLAVFFLPTSTFFLLSPLSLVPFLVVDWRENRSQGALLPVFTWLALSGFHLVSLVTSGGWSRLASGFVVALTVSLLLGTTLRLLLYWPPRVLVLTLAAACVVGSGYWTYTKVTADMASVAEGRKYLEVQQWAKKNTTEESLFMVDPCINYGWRDFSARASLGTPREWFMTGWIYTGDGEVLRKGEEIAGTLGLQLEPTGLGPQSGAEVCDLARAAYYSAELASLQTISDRFGVDFFVLKKGELGNRHVKVPADWKIVFENSAFAVTVPPL